MKFSTYEEAAIERRAKARVKRLIQLAQDKEKKKSASGTSKKSAPSVKTKAAPVQKKAAPKKAAPKKAAPKKAAPKKAAPKKAAPKKAAPKKSAPQKAAPKKAAPAEKKKTAPVETTKKTPVPTKSPPASKAPMPTPGGTPGQQQENKDFCAQNPTSPSCTKEQAPPQQQDACAQNPSLPGCNTKQPQPGPSEKICTANPNYPGCDAMNTQPGQDGPVRTPPPEQSPGGPQGGVNTPTFCESNPNLPQCREQQPDNNQPPPFNPPAPEETGQQQPNAPSFIPPPPTCPAGQELVAGFCVDECPSGQERYLGFCVDSECPEGQERVGGVCVVTVCPEGTELVGAACVQNCPTGPNANNALQLCVPDCTGNTERVGLLCLERCPGGMIREGTACVPRCPLGQGWQVEDGTGSCVACGEFEAQNINGNCQRVPCPTGTYDIGGTCTETCPDNYDQVLGLCLPGCAGNEQRVGTLCITVCEHELSDDGQCIDRWCPKAMKNVNGVCKPECPDNSTFDMAENMCMPDCKENESPSYQGDRMVCKPPREEAADEPVPPPPPPAQDEQPAEPVCMEGEALYLGQCVPTGTGGCADDEVLLGGQCQPTTNICSNWGQTQQGTGNNLQCVDSCQNGQVELLDRCVGISYCSVTLGGSFENGHCVLEPPEPEAPAPAEDEQTPPGSGTPPVEEQQPPESEQSPPETQEPPVGGEQTPPETEQAPPEGEQPPSDTQEPPPDTGTPPPPPDTDQVPPPTGGETFPVPWPPDTGGAPPPGKEEIEEPASKEKTLRASSVETRPVYLGRMKYAPPLAIVISVDKYTDSGVPQALYAKAGADSFMAFLEQDEKLERSRILRLENPTRSDLQRVFSSDEDSNGQLLTAKWNAIPPPSEVIIYFAGHGIGVDDGEDAVLLPSDGAPGTAATTGYSLKTLYLNLQRTGVRRLRLYLDTGFSETPGETPSSGETSYKPLGLYPVVRPDGKTRVESWVVISAGSGDQPVLTGQTTSAFSTYLLRGLRGEADISGYRDGVVRAGELITYLQRNVWTQAKVQTGGNQMPSFWGRLSEILHVPDGGASEPAPPSTPAPPAPPPPAPEPEKKAEPAAPAAPAKPVKPSFDCRKARAPAEKAICANPAIATLDNVMAGLYRQARAARRGAARTALTAQQREWLKRRDACGLDVACLAQRYGERIGQLQ